MDDQEKNGLLEKEDKRQDLKSAKSTWKSVIGVLVMCATTFLASFSAICVQGLNRRIPDFELNAIRSVLGWMGIAVFSLCCHLNPVVAKEEIIWVALYTFLGTCSTATYFIAVTFIPMATEEAIYHTTQIFGGLFLLWIIIGEKPTLENISATVICVLGVFLVLQPDFSFPTLSQGHVVSCKHQDCWNETVYENKTVYGNETINGNDLYTEHGKTYYTYLGCGLAVATGIVMVFRLSAVKSNPDFFGVLQNQPKVIFWVSLCSAILSTIITVTCEKPVLPETYEDYFLVAGHGISYILTYPGFLFAASVLDGNSYNILWTTSTVYMVIAQYTVLKDIHPGHRNWIEIVGVGCVLLGCVMSPLVKIVKQKYR